MKLVKLEVSNQGQAAALLSTAMLYNPVHLTVFGTDQALRKRRLNKFFQIMLPLIHKRGGIYAAYIQSDMIAVLGYINAGYCSFSLFSRIRLLVLIFTSFTPIIACKLIWWLLIWRKHDMRAAHMHLGPLAVLEPYRKHGVASALLKQVMASEPAVWLETDLPANVSFYKKLGFVEVKQISVLGIKTWLCLKQHSQ